VSPITSGSRNTRRRVPFAVLAELAELDRGDDTVRLVAPGKLDGTVSVVDDTRAERDQRLEADSLVGAERAHPLLSDAVRLGDEFQLSPFG
jgi:hypothetical protein